MLFLMPNQQCQSTEGIATGEFTTNLRCNGKQYFLLMLKLQRILGCFPQPKALKTEKTSLHNAKKL